MKNNKNKLVDEVSADDYARRITTTLTTEALRLIDSDTPQFGPDWALTVQLNLVASLLANVIQRSLNDEPSPATSMEDNAGVSRTYKSVKDAIESTVSAAFQGAWSTHTGNLTEFFVQITPVPEPANVLPC